MPDEPAPAPRAPPMTSYTCPNCNEALVLDKPVAAGKKVKCGNCDFVFIPVKDTFAVAPEPAKPKKAAKAAAPAAPAAPEPFKYVDDTDLTAYGVAQESEA